MNKQIEEMYKKQKNRRLKAVVTGIVIYTVMMSGISVFLGNPFPHKENVLVWETTVPGWVITDSYLLWVCAVVGVLVVVGNTVCSILRPFHRIDQILLRECDARRYLEMMDYAVTYGERLKWKGLQKTVFWVSEQKYVTALTVNQKFEEAEYYLNQKYKGKANSRAYRLAVVNLELAEKFAKKEEDSFCKTLLTAGKPFATNRLIIAKKFLLKRDYETAAAVLAEREEKIPYYEVGRNFLLGECYAELGNQSQAAECMKFVERYGNTLPCKAIAQEWLSRTSLFFLEQKENFSE